MHLAPKKSFYFMTLVYAMLIMVGMSVQSCATMGYENVDTTRKAIVVGVAEVRAANLLLQDLIDRRAISRSDADAALRNLQSAKNQLQTALSAVDVAGDPVTANKGLERAKVTLSVAMALLAPLVEEN